VAYGVNAGTEVADPIGWIWHCIVFFLDLTELQRSDHVTAHIFFGQ
jgi:hypothetical protein